jgi:hypothetical protein
MLISFSVIIKLFFFPSKFIKKYLNEKNEKVIEESTDSNKNQLNNN